jgi:hypothetical protein
VNGSNGAFRIDAIGRNTFRQPSTLVPDLRLSKSVVVKENYTLEVLGNMFNIINKPNVTQVNGQGYNITAAGGTANGVACPAGPNPCLIFNPASGPINSGFGSITNENSNFVYSPRQIEIGVRIKF